MIVQPYLSFEGRCEEAVNHYQRVLGARVEMMMRMKDAPPGPNSECSKGSEEKIMHSSFTVGESLIMATDGMCSGKASFEGVSLSLSVKDAAEANRVFSGLADGGEVRMPLGQTFFSPCFGMVKDRFGVSWMVIVPQPMS